MAIGEKVWFCPFESPTSTLQTAYDAAPEVRKINDADAFTISLDAVLVPRQAVQEGLWPHLRELLRGDTNILITSTTTVGARPGVQRVHYFGPAHQFEVAFADFISDTIYVTSDFHPPSQVHLTLEVTQVDTGTEERDDVVQALNGLAETAGAVFPVVLPYSIVAGGVATAANKLLNALTSGATSRISEVIRLYPPGKSDDIDLQVGRYVAVDQDRDLSHCSLRADGKLLRNGAEVLDIPYVVFRIERGDAPSPDFVVAQRMATLLTQLHGGGTDPTKSSIQFVGDTLTVYSQFRDLERYAELLKKQKANPNSLTDAEKAVMARLQSNSALEAFLPR